MKLKFTTIVFCIAVILIALGIRFGKQKEIIDYTNNLDLVAVTVDGKELTLGDLAFYVAYEEGSIEEDALVYNPDNTQQYWNIFTNHTYIRKAGKRACIEMAIHDEIFYEAAKELGLELDSDDMAEVENSQTDFWNDLTDLQKEKFTVDQDIVNATIEKVALAQKYQYFIAAYYNKDYSDFEFSGDEYEELLEDHEVVINDSVWDRVNFGAVTLDH